MPANSFNGHTDYGIGIGLRVPHYRHILEKKPVVDWFESERGTATMATPVRFRAQRDQAYISPASDLIAAAIHYGIDEVFRLVTVLS